MGNTFPLLLLGHLMGDYLFQTKYMALHKSDARWTGFKTCSVHVLMYTIAVCLMLETRNPLVWLMVFVPHWVIDRWLLASAWLKFIKGRTFEAVYNSKDPYREFDIAFTALVYAVVDNTFHLLSLWLVAKFFL